MSNRLYNLAREFTDTTGIGPITLDGPVQSFLAFAQAGAHDGETISYAIDNGIQREVGRGVLSNGVTHLTRNVLSSTNNNLPINLNGRAQVSISAIAQDFEIPPGINVGASAPSPATQGQGWLNTANNRLSVFDGTNWQEVTPDLAGYATEGWVNSQGFATQSWVNGFNFLTSANLAGYATETWVGNQNFATQAWVNGFNFLTAVPAGYATETWVSSHVDARGYATETWVNGRGFLTAVPAGYATETWVGLQNFATQGWVQSQNYLTAVPAGYATETWVGNNYFPLTGGTINGNITVTGGVTIGGQTAATQNWVQSQGYLTSVPAGYATESWVGSQGFITSAALAGYATESWVGSQGFATTSWVQSQNYLTAVPAGYATESWVNSQGFITSWGPSSVIALSAPTPRFTGDLWLDGDNRTFYVHNGTSWSAAKGGAWIGAEPTNNPPLGYLWLSDVGRDTLLYTRNPAGWSRPKAIRVDSTAPTADIRFGDFWWNRFTDGSGTGLLLTRGPTDWEMLATCVVSATTPAYGANVGTTWFNTTTRVFNVHDNTGWQPAMPMHTGDTAPTNPAPNTWWFDTTTMGLFLYHNSQWVEVASPTVI
jgi:hypothetical protein